MTHSRLRDLFDKYKTYLRRNVFGLPRLLPLPDAVYRLNDVLETLIDVIEHDLKPALDEINARLNAVETDPDAQGDIIEELQRTNAEQETRITALEEQLAEENDDDTNSGSPNAGETSTSSDTT